jgi:Tol biopolymer transport system component/DNA-binding winged helix-turn-helix (wHTH) protein
MSPRPFLLGDFRVEPSLNQLSRGSTSSRVTPKAMEVLVVLAASEGDAVTREELLDSVWSDVTVNEEVLTRAVADLRKVLDDDARRPRYIETIPKRGYRLVAPVTFVDREPAPRSPRRSMFWPAIASALAALGLVALGLRDPVSSPLLLQSLEAEPLTSLPGREVLPALSPDGTRVAFSWQGASADNWDVYVKDVGSESMVRLTVDPAVDAAAVWSSDGRRVAFARYREGEACRILEIDAARADAGVEREIGSCGASQNPDLASDPSGALLAFSDRDAPDESFGIYLLERETGKRRKLVAPDGQHWGDKDPVFSSDGKWIAFTRSVSMNTQDVYRVPVEGGPAERVTFDGREIRRSSFTVDGKAIVVSSARNGHLALWRVPLDGGEPEWLSYAGSSLRSPSIGRGGELVFEDRSGDSDIASVALGTEGEPAGTLVRSTREESEPALSPDGIELAFVSTRSGSPEIWKYDLSSEGEAPVRLTGFGGPHVSSPRWSGDGTRIAFDARPDGHADVYWISASAPEKPRRVTSDPSNDLAPSFSHDRRHLFFGSDRSGAWQIWKASVEGDSAPECVTRNGGYVSRSSSDGRSLYFTKFDRAGLFRLDLSTGDEVAVEGADGWIDASLWDLVGDELVFTSRDSMTVRVLVRNLSTGDEAEIATVDARPGGGLAFHPGRDLLLFTRVVRAESDLFLARVR